MIVLQDEIKRFVSLGGLLSSVAGFVASLWFYDTFVWIKNTTMYIPFLWGVDYTDPGSVLNFVYYFSIGCLIVGLISAYSLGSLHNNKPPLSLQRPIGNRMDSNSHVSLESGKEKSSRLLKNIWLLRTLVSSAMIVVSSLLLIYSLIFRYTFYTYNRATSYFPWSWQVSYANTSSVATMFYLGVGLSVALLTVFWAALIFMCIPKFRESSRRRSVSLENQIDPVPILNSQ